MIYDNINSMKPYFSYYRIKPILHGICQHNIILTCYFNSVPLNHIIFSSNKIYSAKYLSKLCKTIKIIMNNTCLVCIINLLLHIQLPIKLHIFILFFVT